MLSDADLDRLQERLLAAGYTVDAVLERLGESGRRGLDRNSTTPARDALGATDDPQATLVRLWILQDAVDAAAVTRALGEASETLFNKGLLARDGEDVRATAVIRPYGVDAVTTSETATTTHAWICHDPLPNLDGRSDPPAPDHVLGVSPASTTLAQMTIRRPVATALDLGTGCGVQSLHLARHAGRVVATDLNPRALALANITLGLSRTDADLRLGSLYDPVAADTFDLIVSNPPFVISPPSTGRLTYREGDLPGDELVRRVVTEGAARLTPQGTLQVLCNWAIVDGEPWDERLATWIRPTGCDALVLQRETLDPHEYVELWLADAGLDAAPDHPARYRDWLDYLAAHRITGIGLGWINLRNAGRATPDLRLEDWPFDVHQPIGDALAEQQHAVDLAGRDDASLLATRWRTHPGIKQETIGRPGAEDPEHIVLRQTTGLGRATEADTAVAALVGACDGDLAASEIIAALATLLDVDADALQAELTPRLRQLIADGYLID